MRTFDWAAEEQLLWISGRKKQNLIKTVLADHLMDSGSYRLLFMHLFIQWGVQIFLSPWFTFTALDNGVGQKCLSCREKLLSSLSKAWGSWSEDMGTLHLTTPASTFASCSKALHSLLVLTSAAVPGAEGHSWCKTIIFCQNCDAAILNIFSHL